MKRVRFLTIAALMAGMLAIWPLPRAAAIETCPYDNPPDTCVLAGDTWIDNGITYRHAIIDTPETWGREVKCREEIELGKKARTRLIELLSDGFTTIPADDSGIFGKPHATIRLPDGREAGAILMAEGLAEPYAAPNGRDWCAKWE